MSLQFTIVGTEDGSNITVFVPGQAPLVAHSSHPNYEKIVEGALAQDESVTELFDIAQTAATKFERLTERVTVANGRLYLDGVEVDNALSTQVLRFLDEGVEDWKPLVNFFENVQQNPQEYSREQLYNWLNTENFTITPNGLIVGYKGVKAGPDADTWLSINSGRATVDGEVKEGYIPNRIGSVVEMPRNEVTFDPSNGCSHGLHVGTYSYANNFGHGHLLEVHVNPRDVVSVPNDSHSQKMRVCRYVVAGKLDGEYTTPLVDDYYDDFPEEEFEVDEWGEVEYEDHPEDTVQWGGEFDVKPEAAITPNTPSTPGYWQKSGPNTVWVDQPQGDPGDEHVEKTPNLDAALSSHREAITADLEKVYEDAKNEALREDNTVQVGDRFEDTDPRRKGNIFTVTAIDGNKAVGKGRLGLTRKIKIKRLLSRKYRRVS